MDENTEAESASEAEGNDLIKNLRKELSKAQAEAKRLAEENQVFQEARAQSRTAQVDQAVNGQNYPQAIVDAIKAQVEVASDEEFDKLLQDLGSAGEQAEGVQEEQPEAAPATPSPADIGQRVAAAAGGNSGEVDVAKEIATADTREALLAAVAKHGLDKF